MVLLGYASTQVVIGGTVAFTIVAVLFAALRLYARFFVSKTAGWDDAFISISVIFSIATAVTIIAQCENGMGKHMKELDKAEGMRQQRDFFIMIIVYNISLTFTKLSILLQYTRIFPQKGFRIATWVVMGAVTVYALWRFFSAIFTCSPVAAFWDHSIKPFTCQDKYAIAMASTSLNMATDVTIAILPLPMLNKLQLPRRQRYALMSVFALAGLVVIISILRLPSLITLWKTKDVSYVNPMVMVWSDIEINVGIICSCLPTLRCLFPKIFKAATGYAAYGRSAGSEGSHSHNKSKASRKSTGYAFVGGGSGGQGSFGGKFSTKVSVSKVGNAHSDAVPIRRGRQGTLLESVEEIELTSSRDSAGKIMVQTEIQQVESKGFDSKSVGSGRDFTKMERELV